MMNGEHKLAIGEGRIKTAMALGIIWRNRIQARTSKDAGVVQLLGIWLHKHQHYCIVVRHFCLAFPACPVPPNDPKCLRVADYNPVSRSFW